MDSTVRTVNLIRRYPMGDQAVDALAGVDLVIRSGEFVAMVGVSGSGKSTLLHLIGGLDRPTAGQVWVDGVELGLAGEADLTRHRRQRVGLVFQTFNLLPRLTALENVALPLMFAGIPRRERETRARVLLKDVGLSHRLHHYPTQLSGGEQQRVAIARALVHNPAVILADEPTGNLDSKTGAEILALLQRLNRERGVTVILVSHDPAAADVADRVIHLRDGRVERDRRRPTADRRSGQGIRGAGEVEKGKSGKGKKGKSGKEAKGDKEKSPFPLFPFSLISLFPLSPRLGSPASLRWSDLLRSALSNLGRRVVRSGLTVFGVFVGIITIVAMLAVAVGVQQEMRRNIEAVGLESVFVTPQNEADPFDPFADPRPETPITPATVATLRQMPEVASIAPLVDLPPYLELRVKWGDQAVLTRVRNSMERFNPFEGQSQVLAGRDLAPGETHGAVLSARLARELGAGDYDALAGQEVILIVRLPRGETGEFPVTVLGVRQGRRGVIDLGVGDAAAIKRWWYGQPDLLETRGYDGLAIRAAGLAAVPAVEDRARAMGFQARSLRTFLNLANRIFAVLNALLGSVGGLALFVASLGVANTMIMAVYERTREIGVLKAVGAARGDVLRLFMAEAALIGFLGGVFGLVLGALLARGVDWAAHQYLVSQGVRGIGSLSAVPWWLALGAVAFGTLVGLVAGVYPALRAARLDPVVALRYE